MRPLRLLAAYTIVGIAGAVGLVAIALFVLGKKPWQLLDWADRCISGGVDL